MRIIKTNQDIEVLCYPRVVPAVILNQIEIHFLDLRNEHEEEEGKEFRLERNGYIVILETGDNVRNVGLNETTKNLEAQNPHYPHIFQHSRKFPTTKFFAFTYGTVHRAG